MRKIIKVGALSYAQLVKHMIEGIYTCQDLADMTGLHLTTVYQYTREIHAAGAAHIAYFEPDARGRHNVKVYKLGVGKDANKPRIPAAERQRRTRAKRKHLEMMHRAAGSAKGLPLETSAAQTSRIAT